MKIQYLGYLVIIAAFYAGFRLLHPLAIPGLALLSTFIFMAARRQQTQSEKQSIKPNLFVDGLYLFAVQALIMLTVYMLGYFISTEAGSSFLDFFTTGGRT